MLLMMSGFNPSTIADLVTISDSLSYLSKFRRLTFCGNNTANKVVDLTLYSKGWVEARHTYVPHYIQSWSFEMQSYVFIYWLKSVYHYYLYLHIGAIEMNGAVETHLTGHCLLSNKMTQFPCQILRHHSLKIVNVAYLYLWCCRNFWAGIVWP